VIGVLLFGCVDLWHGVAVAQLSPSLRTSSSWFGNQLLAWPISPQLVMALAYLAAAMGVLIAIGLWTRLALVIGTLSALYVLGISQLAGSVWHSHHLLWFLALLTVSPCADSWSLDSLLWKRRNQIQYNRDPLCYGLPIRLAWLLLAAILFFPGLWKLRGGGLAWITSDNLRNQLHWKWVQNGGVLPWLRIDRFAVLCKLLAASVVCFELGFPLLLLHKRLRVFAVGLALLFHLGTWHLMQISFTILWPCYAVLFNWKGVWEWLRKAQKRNAPPPELVDQKDIPSQTQSHALSKDRSTLLPTIIMGFLLILGVGLSGWRGWTQSYPFACYPTFQHLAGDAMPALLLTVEDDRGKTQELPRPWTIPEVHSSRAVALMWSVLRKQSPQALAAYLDTLRQHPTVAEVVRTSCPGRVHFDRVLLPVSPELWQSPPTQRQRLATVPLPCPP
jgi:hypothetical protein